MGSLMTLDTSFNPFEPPFSHLEIKVVRPNGS